MSIVTAVLAEAGLTQLPVPAFVYGLVALATFGTLGVVVWSYRDVSNRHQAKAKAYADAHGGARSGH